MGTRQCNPPDSLKAAAAGKKGEGEGASGESDEGSDDDEGSSGDGEPSSPLELVNSTLSTSHTPDMHSVIFCVSAEYLQPACEQRGEPPLVRAGARFEAPFEARFEARFDVGQRA